MSKPRKLTSEHLKKLSGGVSWQNSDVVGLRVDPRNAPPESEGRVYLNSEDSNETDEGAGEKPG